MGETGQDRLKPKRTIVYNAWDGEEPGLLGSTEWVEDHAETLAKNAVAYINTDSNGRGFLGVGGSHTLEKFINEVGRDIPDPQTTMSVWERARAQQMVSGSPAEKKEAKDRPDLRIDALGSGSDFTPFLQHLALRHSISGLVGKTAAARITRSTIRSRTTRVSAIPITRTALPWQKFADTLRCGWQTPIRCRSSLRISRKRCRAMRMRSPNWPTRCVKTPKP